MTGGILVASPSRRGEAISELNQFITKLTNRWQLGLEAPRETDSPKKRQSLARVQKRETAAEVVSKIKYLWWRNNKSLSSAIDAFENDAVELLSGWVRKTGAEPDVLPIRTPTRLSPYSFTPNQAAQLLQLLRSHVSKIYDDTRNEVFIGRPSDGRLQTAGKTDQQVPGAVESAIFDDGGIPFNLSLTRRTKRPSGDSDDTTSLFKKPKIPQGKNVEPGCHGTIEKLPIRTYDTRAERQRRTIQQESLINQTTSLDGSFQDIARPQDPTFGIAKKLLVSETSFSSTASSVFTRKDNETSFSTTTSIEPFEPFEISTQEDAYPAKATSEGRLEDSVGSHYDSNVFDETMFDIMDMPENVADLGHVPNVEKQPVIELLERLHNVFPAIPEDLKDECLAVRYEIFRVFLYAEVSLSKLQYHRNHGNDLTDYKQLWTFLQNQPCLQKKLPEKSAIGAWNACLKDFRSGYRGVKLSIILRINPKSTGPLFLASLRPLALDVSHRLGRRFGNDRFIEMSVPSLIGDEKSASVLSRAGRAGKEAVIKWLTNTVHEIIGNDWKPFYVRDEGTRRVAFDLLSQDEISKAAYKRVFLFAVDGCNFRRGGSVPLRDEDPHAHTAASISTLLNWLIPLAGNKDQSYLKLFSRVALGLSKTYATVSFLKSQIRYPDDKRNEVEGSAQAKAPVMNDGCGQISFSAAMDIARMLGLSSVPSGYQARIAGAKGFWTVSPDNHDGHWIELYPSQIKFALSRNPYANLDVEHTTFEVVKWVTPLRVAALNLQFLPVLEDRAIDKKKMRESVKQSLENGLTHELAKQRAAMENPFAFRKWIGDNSSGLQDRVKSGMVTYKGGQPTGLEEKINMLLDAGFEPKKLTHLKEMSRKVFRQKCDVLKEKMNITVGRSTYAYMAYDFTGTLEENEIHIGFSSSFHDELSETHETLLHGQDVLVARSPAHLPSDIQKVKAVFSPQLKHIKDVVVFSGKGRVPLASKLSGGDYDGDISFLTWEPGLVANFKNAEVPECPNLVDEGYLHKTTTKYSELLILADPVGTWLEKSFLFNFQENLLGICTSYKEQVCYSQNNVSNDRAVFLSTLVGDLVDQAKQGYSFTQEALDNIKANEIKIRARKPAYKTGNLEGKKAVHIIDYLRFAVAEPIIEHALADLHHSLGDTAVPWDKDVAKIGRWARERADESADWKSLIEKLEADIDHVKNLWMCNFKAGDSELVSFSDRLSTVYEAWLAIRPTPDNPLSSILYPSYLPDLEMSEFALIKASLAFGTWSRKSDSSFVWWMAGKQLCTLKARQNASGTGVTPITGAMHAMLKPDARFVKLRDVQPDEPRYVEASVEDVPPEEDVLEV